MGLFDAARLLALLRRIARYPRGFGPDPRVHEALACAAPSGALHDVYVPAGGSKAVLVAVHGGSLLGRTDPRLVHFARSLALSGVTCAVPTLPGLATLRWISPDIDCLSGLVGDLAARFARPVGLIGFSYGAGYCLVAAARPEVATSVRFVLGFGAFHSAFDLQERYRALRGQVPPSEQAWDDFIYVHLALAHQAGARLGLPAELLADTEGLLLRYCNESSMAEKRAFFDRNFRDSDVVGPALALEDPADLRAVSPAGHLAGIRCPVSLVHARDDWLSPVEQAERIMAELPDGTPKRLLVTSVFTHVQLRDALNPLAVGRLLALLAPLVRSGSAP